MKRVNRHGSKHSRKRMVDGLAASSLSNKIVVIIILIIIMVIGSFRFHCHTKSLQHYYRPKNLCSERTRKETEQGQINTCL